MLRGFASLELTHQALTTWAEAELCAMVSRKGCHAGVKAISIRQSLLVPSLVIVHDTRHFQARSPNRSTLLQAFLSNLLLFGANILDVLFLLIWNPRCKFEVGSGLFCLGLEIFIEGCLLLERDDDCQ